jgi:hypothetical protein
MMQVAIHNNNNNNNNSSNSEIKVILIANNKYFATVKFLIDHLLNFQVFCNIETC